MTSVLIKVLPVLIALLVFLLIVFSAKSVHPQKTILKAYERVNGLLHKAKTGVFDYERTQEFLDAYGATYHYCWITPIKYLIVRLLVAIIFFLLGINIHVSFGLLLMLIGFFLPWFGIHRKNKKDNQVMMIQIMDICNVLVTQIRAGVQITNALSECYRGLEKGRLRNALEELSAELFLKAEFEEAIRNFKGKFDNSSIDSLCITLLQARESGKVIEILGTLTSEIRYIEMSQQNQKKNKLNRTTTYCFIGVLALVLIMVIYALITDMYSGISSF